MGVRPTASRRTPHLPGPARDRFLALDDYRVQRERQRYEGTPQRDLFRELRTRFLQRHAVEAPWVADLGSGPGRFTAAIGGPASRRVLLDLSQEMLREARRSAAASGAAGRPHLVRGDAARPPFRSGRFGEVVLLGNVVGFSEANAERVLDAALDLLAPDGTIIVESVAGTGERSRYLTRLPEGAVRRLLLAPINLVRPRLEREGFRPEGAPAKGSAFRRFSASELEETFRRRSVAVREVMAVAAALGADADRIAAVRGEPRAWRHLLELEEAVGRNDARHPHAAALLIAGRRGASPFR